MGWHPMSHAPQDEVERRSASVGLRIKPSLKAALAQLAKADGRTLNFYIERAMEEHLQRQAQARARQRARMGRGR
jgi:hypothetical protein